MCNVHVDTSLRGFYVRVVTLVGDIADDIIINPVSLPSDVLVLCQRDLQCRSLFHLVHVLLIKGGPPRTSKTYRDLW